MSLNYGNGMYSTDNGNWKGVATHGNYVDNGNVNNFWSAQDNNNNNNNINNNNVNNMNMNGNNSFYNGNDTMNNYNNNNMGYDQQNYNNINMMNNNNNNNNNNNMMWNQQQQPSYAQIAGVNNNSNINNNNNIWNQQQQQMQQPILQPPQPPQLASGSSLIVPPPTFKKKKSATVKVQPTIAKPAAVPVVVPALNNGWNQQFNNNNINTNNMGINNNWNQQQQQFNNNNQINTNTILNNNNNNINNQPKIVPVPVQPIKKIISTTPPITTTTPAKTTTTTTKKIKPSVSLTNYVQRAFKSAESQEQLKEMQNAIKEKIAKGGVDVIDWDNEPLPQLPSKVTPITTTTTNNKSVWDNDMVPLSTKVKKDSKQDKKRKATVLGTSTSFDSPNSQNKRFQRFGSNGNGGTNFSAGTGSYSSANFGVKESQFDLNGELDWDSLTIKGTSTDLEKPYLRLTSAPEPSSVRPEEVLRKTLSLLKKKWLEKEDYTYTCEQFRSVRQDLTVQRIKNKFTVEVYETHARLALENQDLGQFNQCQTQLFQLYKQPGLASSSMSEFFAYRLLYNIYQDNANDITKTMSEIDKDKNGAGKFAHVVHALKIRTAIYNNNYCSYFKLCRDPPNMAIYLLEKITPRVRVQALKMILKAYRPTISIGQIADLGFKNEKEAQEFVDKNKLVWVNKIQKKEIDAKLSSSIVIEAPVAVVHAVDGRW